MRGMPLIEGIGEGASDDRPLDRDTGGREEVSVTYSIYVL